MKRKERKKKITTIMVKKKLQTKFLLKEFVKSAYKIMLKKNLQQITWEEAGKFKVVLRRKSEPVEIYKRSEEKKEDPGNAEKKNNNLNYIKAPMNGIFYINPSPGAEPFVRENDEIAAGDTVCIIEAMKLMNEVQVEHSCRIVKILADNGASVKVNQPIFEIEYL